MKYHRKEFVSAQEINHRSSREFVSALTLTLARSQNAPEFSITEEEEP